MIWVAPGLDGADFQRLCDLEGWRSAQNLISMATVPQTIERKVFAVCS